MSVELLDFYADWCAPCKIMEPTIDEIERDMAGQVKITKIDTDEDQSTISKYGIMSIPTYVILKDGSEVDRFIGATSKDVMRQKIKSHIS